MGRGLRGDLIKTPKQPSCVQTGNGIEQDQLALYMSI